MTIKCFFEGMGILTLILGGFAGFMIGGVKTIDAACNDDKLWAKVLIISFLILVFIALSLSLGESLCH